MRSVTITSGWSRSAACEQGAAVLDDADELELGLEQALQALGDDPVVVGEEDARPAHATAPGERNPGQHDRALSRDAGDLQPAADEMQAFAQAHVAEPQASAACTRIETDAVVAHAELERAIRRAQSDRHPAGVRVAGDVAQRLLGDPVEAERRVGGELRRRLREAQLDLDALGAGEALDLGAQGVGEPEVVEDGGMKPAGERVHVVAQPDELLAHAAQRRAATLARLLPLDLRGVDGEAGEPLGQVVVELPRQPASLLLEGGEQAAVEGPHLALGGSPVAALHQQPDDQCRLQGEDPQPTQKRPAIGGPGRR